MTGTLVSGYQGSPLGGLDQELQRRAEICAEHHVRHVPGLNEELGATSAWGSQLAGALPGSRYDGVVGMWYGKAPGLDRAADSLRHGNFVGVSRTGGALAVVGDDPARSPRRSRARPSRCSRASTCRCSRPATCRTCSTSASTRCACSRASGLWSGFKVVTNVADASGTAEVGTARG